MLAWRGTPRPGLEQTHWPLRNVLFALYEFSDCCVFHGSRRWVSDFSKEKLITTHTHTVIFTIISEKNRSKPRKGGMRQLQNEDSP